MNDGGILEILILQESEAGTLEMRTKVNRSMMGKKTWRA
jgi:hypothetical protein